MPKPHSNGPVAAQLKQALALQRQGNLPKAQWLFQQVLGVDPYNAAALEGLGLLLARSGRFEEALHCFTRASVALPTDANVYFNCGTAQKELGRYDAALNSFDRAIALNPRYAEAHSSRGRMLNELGRYDEALASFDAAIAYKGSFANAHNNRGAILHGIFNRYDEALASFNRAIALKPDFVDAYFNRAYLLRTMGRAAEAMADYDRIVASIPGHVEANFGKAILKLLAGDFEGGWPLYEWRWKTDQLKKSVRHFDMPLWLGDEPIAGKTLLVYGEQGLGDVIQMARYLPLLVAQRVTVIMEAPVALVALLRTLECDFTLIEKGGALPAFDYHCPVMSLPLAFRTTLDTIPAPAHYLTADRDKRAEWQKRLGGRNKTRVGLVWSGSRAHLHDHHRSIPVTLLAPLLGLDLEFHSLQQEVREEDRAALAESGQVHCHEAELRDFSDTAALMAELDLVISVDTSVAHLAGAMGKPVWIVLPYAPDFRWLMERSDSPWYPSARLFRQPQPGEWGGVIAAILAELKGL